MLQLIGLLSETSLKIDTNYCDAADEESSVEATL